MAVVAIARRRKLLNDDLIIAFAECSWEILDREVQIFWMQGLITHAVMICKNLRAMDISLCGRLSSNGVSVHLQHCHALKILRWGPTFDKNSEETLALECPRIIVNPKPSPLGFMGSGVPQEALLQCVLDGPIVKDIDPRTWAVSGFITRTALQPISSPDKLPIAEKFRLPFHSVSPKEGKERKTTSTTAEREWVMMSSREKALAVTSQAKR